MIALGLLICLVTLVALALLAGHLAFRWTGSRWAQLGVCVLVLWLPFWDVLPGWLAYKKAVRQIGGRRVYRTVQADGYLDLSRTDGVQVWRSLTGTPFCYIEIKRNHPSQDELSPLERQPGYYTYRLRAQGDPGCAATERIPNIDRAFDYLGLTGLCVSTDWRASALSRYEYESHPYEPLPDQAWPAEVYASWERVTDRATHQVIAESYTLEFRAWFWPFGLSSWKYDQDDAGRSFALGADDVIKKPDSSAQGASECSTRLNR